MHLHSKQVRFHFMSFILPTVLLLIFSNCQEERIEITPTPPDQVILPNSVVANFIQHITLNDGSSDNILDHSSCTSLILPVSILVNGQEILISSEDDLNFVERVLDEFDDDDDTLNFIFPITVTLTDHTQLTINNTEEFENAIAQCIEGGNDDDIECIDFKYPLTLLTFNSDNQVSDVLSIDDDQELFSFIDHLDNNLLVSIKFPITLILSNGVNIIITNNTELEDSIEAAIDDCDEDDDNNHNDDDIDDSGLIAFLIDGEWRIIDLFIEQDSITSFTDLSVTFNTNNTISSTDGVVNFEGKWKTFADDESLNLKLDFDDGQFDIIEINWELTEFSNSIIKLKNEDSDGKVNIMILQKI